MKQFYEMKARHPDTILFFQMGDFYETFGEDAIVVARELDITLTARGKDLNGEKMPLAGVPIHAGEAYITRMVKKGYRVAVCDQVEDPKKAKGVVKRDVVRIITPGTVIDSGMLSSSGPSYLMAIAPDKKKKTFGLAFLDISTGEFFVSSCGAKNEGVELFSEIARHRPTECIIPSALPGFAIKLLTQQGVLVTSYNDCAFDYDNASSFLMDHFNVGSLEGYGLIGMDTSVSAAGACLSYACETQKSGLPHIRGLSACLPSGSLVLDAITLRNLEVLGNIRNSGTDSSLLSVLDVTMTPMGSRTLRSFIIAPLTDKEKIDQRLDAVEFFVNQPVLTSDLRTLLHRYADVERIAGRISYGNAGPRDLVTLKNSLDKIPQIKELFDIPGVLAPQLISESLSGISDSVEISALISRAIVDEPPVLVKNGGVIRDGYDNSLDELRDIAGSGKSWIAAFQETERERTGIKSLKIGYNRVFGYFIEVTKANVKLVPENYLRKQTLSNGERYTIPELQEKEALIVNAEERLTALEGELYAGLIKTLCDYVTEFQETAGNVGLLDLFSTLATIAQKNRYVRPVIEESKRLLISDGRHPVVERTLNTGFVPNDADLDARGNQILIITGANMAGKSTYMREIALICIMGQMGSFVPADHAVIGIVDRIFTRVGAFDDLASGQSTFMVEMLELANILNNATDRSLVILDEIGRGTSTLDGFSIAKSVLEYLHGRGAAGPRTLFATHFHELVEVETELKRVKNHHFAVKDTGNDVVFLRKLIPGATDRSYGIHVAKLAGIPEKVTMRSEEILKFVQDREYGSGDKKMPRYTQMLLVDLPATVPVVHPVIGELKDLDIDSLTPRDALARLYELQNSVKKED